MYWQKKIIFLILSLQNNFIFSMDKCEETKDNVIVLPALKKFNFTKNRLYNDAKINTEIKIQRLNQEDIHKTLNKLIKKIDALSSENEALKKKLRFLENKILEVKHDVEDVKNNTNNWLNYTLQIITNYNHFLYETNSQK